MAMIRRVAGLFRRLIDALFSGIRPPVESRPPDIDGRRDTGDLDHDRAVLEAKMQDQIGPGGTLG